MSSLLYNKSHVHVYIYVQSGKKKQEEICQSLEPTLYALCIRMLNIFHKINIYCESLNIFNNILIFIFKVCL